MLNSLVNSLSIWPCKVQDCSTIVNF